MKQVYCISGLGADERIFSRLKVPGVEFVYLKWFVPEKGESIGAYANRMSMQVREPRNPAGPHGNPVFLGVSFGGIMAIELAKLYPAARVVLVSSVKSRKELPAWMKWVGALGLYRLVPSRPGSVTRSSAWLHEIGSDFLGAESEEEKRLRDEYVRKVDPAYLYWAVKQIVQWKNYWRPQALHHIHGSKDKTFPIRGITATHVISGGGHFMVMNRAEEMSRILASIL
ncbi:MAG: alpha/beta hydrolase [Bacteroidota bacterium]|nr:alpha/beta hydrolase [Bacteroidota bacterium]MDP4255036.1 alpha/beta hydrolase [Bacteroidota bacterium]MDP4259693.1 alpha/beta hydrolase [Bacteroidota bacterium]